MTLHERHDDSNQQQFDCLPNSLLELMSKKIPKPYSTGQRWFPVQVVVIRKQFPCQDVINMYRKYLFNLILMICAGLNNRLCHSEIAYLENTYLERFSMKPSDNVKW